MLPNNPGGHPAYQDFLFAQLSIYYPNPKALDSKTWQIIERFYQLDLSHIDEMMKDRYSVFGPEPRFPSSMLRCILVALSFQISSYTKWATQLKLNPLYAILSGFNFGDTPGIGTFYDFHKRLWLSDDNNFTPHIKPPKISVSKPKKSGDKADSVEKVSVDELLIQFQQLPPTNAQPQSLLFDIFNTLFLAESINQELIAPEAIRLAGDGTPVVTSAQMRKKRLCSCFDEGICDCQCDRRFSQPDCDIGWDSHRKSFYHGYDLYLLTDATSDNDLPIFPFLSPASRHDSHGFVHTFFHMQAHLPHFNVDSLLLDSAHDAMPLYVYCSENNITPFIDLNNKRGAPLKYKDELSIDCDGVPICKQGLRMRRDGTEPKKFRLKFRCPLMNRKHGGSCPNPCSDAKFGRTVHLPMKDNPRLFNIPTRGSNAWKLQYKNRTSAERAIKRIKIDYQLENGKHRSSREWYCRLFAILMSLHLDAWNLPQFDLQNRLRQAA